MKNLLKKTCSIILVSTIGLSSTAIAAPYTVKSGDSFWKISNQFNVSMESLMKANNANKNTIIYPGQVLQVPTDSSKVINTTNRGSSSRINSRNTVHTVESGDSLWNIANKYGVSIKQILAVNSNIDENSILDIGQKINIPNFGNDSIITDHTINNENNKNELSNEKYGEYLNWFDEVNTLLPIGTVFKVTDFYTEKSFTMKRTIGAFHADCEALTLEDANIIKEIWGGEFSWTRRPIIVHHGNRHIAASMTAMPHAGVDSVEGGKYAKWRSGGYGAGTNYDYVKGNGMDGHVDIHFAGSKRHKDGEVDPNHQECVKIAAGKIK